MEKDERGNPIACPDSGAWLELAAGPVAQAGRDSLLLHAAGCAACAAALKNALRVMEPETSSEEDAMLQQLQSSTPEWRQWTAASLAQRSRAPVAMKPAGWRVRRWLAAAAVAIVAAGAAYWTWSERQPPLTLLARAYTEQRTIELRIPGAAYGPMRVERGGSMDRPAELSESEAAIRRRLDAKPDDADWLRAKGRAELLEWRYAEAIQALQLALDADAGVASRTKAETLTDLATAYFERAEREDRAADYGKAEDLLGQAIQADGAFAAALYNRAIVEERLALYGNAVKDWQGYLRLDPHGPWADDATSRLKALQAKMRAAAPTSERLAEEVPTADCLNGFICGDGRTINRCPPGTRTNT